MILVLVVAAVALSVGLFLFLTARSRLRSSTANPTVEASQVAALAAIGSERCEVTGIARAGSRGLLHAPISGVPCVWHRVQIEALYSDAGIDGEPHQLTEEVSDVASQAPILLEEEDGVVVVDMRNVIIDLADRTTTVVDESALEGIELAMSGARSQGDDTLYARTEWVITDGTKLFVSGRPVAMGDQVGLGQPERGELVVSTRSDIELVNAARRRRNLGAALLAAAVALTVAVALAA